MSKNASKLMRILRSAKDTVQPLDKAKESLEAIERAERATAEAAKEATTELSEEARATKNMAEIADEVQEPLKRLAGPPGDPEEAEHGLKAVAGGAIKAEKALIGLTSGHIGRLGSQLEGVIPLLGGPVGMGAAIGAIALGLHDVIPKLKEWFDTFQEGSKEVRDAEKAIKDFDTAQKSVHEDMKRRSLADIDKQIEVLEKLGEKEFVGIAKEPTLLHELRVRSRVGHERAEQEKAMAGIGPTKAQRTMSEAVKQAITEAGGVAAVIGENAGDVARYVMSSAIAGDRESIETLKQWSPEFATMWNAFDPDKIRGIKEKEAGAKTIADVETKTAKNVDRRRKEIDDSMKFAADWKTELDNAAVKGNEKAMADAQRLKESLDRKADSAEKARRHKEEHDRQQHEKEAERVASPAGQRRALQEEAMGYAQQAMPGMPIGMQERAAHHMVENYNMGLALGHTVQEQVEYAIMQTRRDLARGIMEGMKRNQTTTEIFQATK